MKKKLRLPFVPCLIGLFLTLPGAFAESVEGVPTQLGIFRATPAYQSLAEDGPDFRQAYRFAFSRRGLVAVSGDRRSLVAYRPDGEPDWSWPSSTGAVTGVEASADGRVLAVYQPLNEKQGVVGLLSAAGELLWSRNRDASFVPSGTGKYLLSRPEPMNEVPVEVLDGETGDTLWRGDSYPFAAQLMDEHTLAHVSRGRLRVYAMATGEVLAERDLSQRFRESLSYTSWQLVAAADGSTVSVLGWSSWPSREAEVWTFDRRLAPRWSRSLEPGFPQLVGITEDGSKLCLKRRQGIRLVDNATGTLLWQVDGRILNNGAVVTNRLIALRQVGYTSEVFLLAAGGNLAQQLTSPSIFTLRPSSLRESAGKTSAVTLVQIQRQGQKSLVQLLSEER